jgi:5-deoxy-glucuronate isomerase
MDQVVITPESARWTYSGLRIVELEPEQMRVLHTGSDEMLVVPLAGAAVVECTGESFSLSGRPDVFSGPTDFCYVPAGTEVKISSREGGRFALPSARVTGTGPESARSRSAQSGGTRPPSYGPAASVPIELRGAGAATRQLNNFCSPSAFATDKLMAVECITPAGNWSSWPPHKHDSLGPDEAILEEIYYFEMAATASGVPRTMGEGFALQRLYTTDGDIDLCEQVHHGDVVLIPRGYHGPSVTAPGFDLYYLNVLAGPAPERTMAFCDDPAYHGVRQSWKNQPIDPRLASGRD